MTTLNPPPGPGDAAPDATGPAPQWPVAEPIYDAPAPPYYAPAPAAYYAPHPDAAYAPYTPAPWPDQHYAPPFATPPAEPAPPTDWKRSPTTQLVIAAVHVVALALGALALAMHAPLTIPRAAVPTTTQAGSATAPAADLVREQARERRKLASARWMRAQQASLVSQIGDTQVDGFVISRDATAEASTTHAGVASTFVSDSPAGTWVVRVPSGGTGTAPFRLASLDMGAPGRILAQPQVQRYPFADLVQLKYTELPAGSGRFGWAVSWEGNGLPAPVTLFANRSGTLVSTSAVIAGRG